MRDNDINCPPYAPVLMESTRAIGYSIESAIADVIDNSISARATNVSIKYSPNGTPYIYILDNGFGMNSMEITEAMRYGSCSPSKARSDTDLGRYGLGMKTASLSQCKCLSVVSKKQGEIEGRRWDLDYISKTEKWSLEQLTSEEISQMPGIGQLCALEHGTLVVWQNLDKIKLGSLTLAQSLETKMDDVKKHLELVFHRFLSGEGGPKVRMSLNGVDLQPFDPFFVAKSTVIMDDESIDVPGRSGKVIVRPYILPHPSNMTKTELKKYGGKDGLRSLQGFYIYRNRRLLTWGTWFKLVRKDEFSKLARVKVDIPNSLDDLWTLDVKKSTAYPPEIVKTRLKQLVGSMANGSKRVWTFRQKQEVNSSVVHVWDKVETREGVKYVINTEHPLLNVILNKLSDEDKRSLHQYLEVIQNNLPFNNLHFDLNSDVKIIQDSVDEEKQTVLYLAKVMIKEAIKENHLSMTMEGFSNIEPFMNYMDDINNICKEVKING